MAGALCLSVRVLDDLRKRGCPCIQVPGTTKVLFNPGRVVAWLESQSEGRETVTARRAKERADAVFS